MASNSDKNLRLPPLRRGPLSAAERELQLPLPFGEATIEIVASLGTSAVSNDGEEEGS